MTRKKPYWQAFTALVQRGDVKLAKMVQTKNRPSTEVVPKPTATIKTFRTKQILNAALT